MSYLLDTNHCSYIINGNSQVIDALNTRATDNIGISIITKVCGNIVLNLNNSLHKEG